VSITANKSETLENQSQQTRSVYGVEIKISTDFRGTQKHRV